MPPETEAAEASPASTQTTEGSDANQGAADTSTAADQTDDNSSTSEEAASEATEEKSLRSVVRDAVQKDTEANDDATEEGSSDASSASEDGKSEETDGEKSSDVALDENANEEDTRFDKHPRFQKLLGERNTFKEGHDEYEKIQTFMTENTISPTEMSEVMTVAALVKKDPVKAEEVMTEMLSDLRVALGKGLPEDLQSKVDDGSVDEETAREVAKTRLQNQAQQSEIKASNETREQEEARRKEDATAKVNAEVRTVETELRAKDPDYTRIEKFVADRVSGLIRANGGTPPATPQEARDLIETAYSEVKKDAQSFVPKKTQQRGPTPSTTAASRDTAKPTSLRGAVKLGINQSR